MKLSLPFPARRLTLLRVMALAYLLTAWALWVWLPPEPDKVLELQRHGSQVAFSPDGSSLAVLLPAPDYYSDATIAIINRSDGSLLREFNIGHSSVWDMNWITPDGTLLSAQIHKSGNDVEATTRYYIWNAATGAEVASVLLNDPASADRSSSAVATRDGKYLAYTSWIARSSTLTLKDVPSNAIKMNVVGQFMWPAFSPDNRRLAAVDITGWPLAKLRFWDTATGTETPEFEQPTVEWEGEKQRLGPQQLVFSENSRELVIVCLLWPLDDAKCAAKDARIRVTNGEGDTDPSHLVRRWDTSTGKLLDTKFFHYTIHDSPKGNGKEDLRLVDWQRSRSRARIINPLSDEEELAVSVTGKPNIHGSRAAPSFNLHWPRRGSALLLDQDYGSYGFRLPIWESYNQIHNNTLSLYDRRDKRLLAKIRNQSFGAFSEDGQTLATFSEMGDRLYFWDLPTTPQWSAIFGWPLLPAGIVALIGFIKRRKSNPTGEKEPLAAAESI